jgi:hypothetical protein
MKRKTRKVSNLGEGASGRGGGGDSELEHFRSLT